MHRRQPDTMPALDSRTDSRTRAVALLPPLRPASHAGQRAPGSAPAHPPVPRLWGDDAYGEAPQPPPLRSEAFSESEHPAPCTSHERSRLPRPDDFVSPTQSRQDDAEGSEAVPRLWRPRRELASQTCAVTNNRARILDVERRAPPIGSISIGHCARSASGSSHGERFSSLRFISQAADSVRGAHPDIEGPLATPRR